jgi:hypothetical protein
VSFIDRFQLHPVDFDGCMLGLVNSDNKFPGVLVKKPLKLVTHCFPIVMALSEFVCPGHPTHFSRKLCAGRDAERTEEYTWPLADASHKVRREVVDCKDRVQVEGSSEMQVEGSTEPDDACDNEQLVDTNNIICMPCREYASGESARSFCYDCGKAPEVDEHHSLELREHREESLINASIDDILEAKQKRRDDFFKQGIWNALVTRSLSPEDPLACFPKALEAVDAELQGLRQEWGEGIRFSMPRPSGNSRMHTSPHYSLE